MKNSELSTPQQEKGSSNSSSRSTSGKKLVQARLPFKAITPGASSIEKAIKPTTTTPIVSEKDSTVGRKRKLEYNSDVEECNDNNEVVTDSKVKVAAASKKPKTGDTMEVVSGETIELSDDEVASIGHAKEEQNSTTRKGTLRQQRETPTVQGKSKGGKKRKSIKTPDPSPASGGAGRPLIKLPFNTNKKKKKDSKTSKPTKKDVEVDSNAEAESEPGHTSSDDAETIASKMNPLKKLKIDQKQEGAKKVVDEAAAKVVRDEVMGGKGEPQAMDESKKGEGSDKENKEDDDVIMLEESSEEDEAKEGSPRAQADEEICSKAIELNMPEDQKAEEDITCRRGDSIPTQVKASKLPASESSAKINNDVSENSVSSEDNATETIGAGPIKCTETDEASVKDIATKDKVAKASSTHSKSLDSNSDSGSLNQTKELVNVSISDISSADGNTTKKTLTPKQQKLYEQRRKAREEKERKIAEEKLQRQKEKEEKELMRKREREEKEEQKRREREEKDDQRRKEKEEKERKRLADLEAKNEEKRRKNEAKEEEKRKKEQEREEAELKKKKAAEAFTKFFVPKSSSATPGGLDKQMESTWSSDARNEETKPLAFRPFQVRADMTLAPLCRKDFSTKGRELLDAFFKEAKEESKELGREELYLAELKAGKIVPAKFKPSKQEKKEEEDEDIQMIDELEDAGVAIIEEVHPPIEHFRAKFFHFHENRRPPYYGTWRKRSEAITPRRPFAQDQIYFDYEIDSDLEWEEEEPGESLDGTDDEKEKESEDDDYEVDNEWFVPHGHLSEEEMQNEDDLMGEENNDREAQKAKLKVLQQEFALEMKKKTEKLKPRLVGCIWTDENGNQPELCPNIIWQKLDSYGMLFSKPIIVEEPEQPERAGAADPDSPSGNSNDSKIGVQNDKASEKLKRIALSEEMDRDLIKLVHGNKHSKAFLINEFIAYVAANEAAVKNGEMRGPLKSVVQKKIDECAEWKVVETSVKTKKNKSKTKKMLCWVVSEEVLKRIGLEGLDLKNKWQYVLTPKFGLVKEEEEKEQAVEAVTAVPMDVDVITEEMNSSVDSRQAAAPITDVPEPSMDPTEEPKPKKRVALLMSVARGQQINTPAKNALISQFLKKSAECKAKQLGASPPSQASEAPKPLTIAGGPLIELD